MRGTCISPTTPTHLMVGPIQASLHPHTTTTPTHLMVGPIRVSPPTPNHPLTTHTRTHLMVRTIRVSLHPHARHVDLSQPHQQLEAVTDVLTGSQFHHRLGRRALRTSETRPVSKVSHKTVCQDHVLDPFRPAPDSESGTETCFIKPVLEVITLCINERKEVKTQRLWFSSSKAKNTQAADEFND